MCGRVHLVGLIHHWVAVSVFALGLGVGDGEGFERHIVRHAEKVLGIGDGDVKGGRKTRNCVAGDGAAEAELDRLRTAHPQGSVVAGVRVGVRVDLGFRDGDVVVLVADRQAERDLWVCGKEVFG